MSKTRPILKITPVAAGTSTITVTADDGRGGSAAEAFTVTVSSGGSPGGGGGGGSSSGGGSPSTSTPPGAATPVSDNVIDSAIKQAAKTGKATLEVARDKGAVALKVEQVNRLVQEARLVEVKIGDVQLVVPADVVKAAASLEAGMTQVEAQAKPVTIVSKGGRFKASAFMIVSVKHLC